LGSPSLHPLLPEMTRTLAPLTLGGQVARSSTHRHIVGIELPLTLFHWIAGNWTAQGCSSLT